MADKCSFCEASPAPYGYRLPGLLSEQKKKGYRWVCGDPDCHQKAETLVSAKMGVKR